MEQTIIPPKKIQTAIVVALSALSLFLAFKIITEIKSWSAIDSSSAAQNVISVSGTGEVFAVPDVATITFTVDETGATVEQAQKKATDKNNAAIKYLKDQGIAEKDIRTESYNANPQYDYSQIVCIKYPCPSQTPRIVGYQVTQTTSVKVHDTDKAGKLLTGIGAAGISTINGPSLGIDDEDVIKAEARTKAIADAKAKAAELAKELGVKLGKMTSFSETTGGYPMPMYATMESKMGVGGGRADNAAPDIATGQNKVTVTVQLTYSIR